MIFHSTPQRRDEEWVWALGLIRRVVAPLSEISSLDLPTLFRCKAPLGWSSVTGAFVETVSDSDGEPKNTVPREGDWIEFSALLICRDQPLEEATSPIGVTEMPSAPAFLRTSFARVASSPVFTRTEMRMFPSAIRFSSRFASISGMPSPMRPPVIPPTEAPAAARLRAASRGPAEIGGLTVPEIH